MSTEIKQVESRAIPLERFTNESGIPICGRLQDHKENRCMFFGLVQRWPTSSSEFACTKPTGTDMNYGLASRPTALCRLIRDAHCGDPKRKKR